MLRIKARDRKKVTGFFVASRQVSTRRDRMIVWKKGEKCIYVTNARAADS